MDCRCRHIIRTINSNVVNQPKGVIHDRNHTSTNSLTYIYWCISWLAVLSTRLIKEFIPIVQEILDEQKKNN